MRYRADISGLRALAVVPVVLYHADARLMPGGFVGVDVFFVISGYLITSILVADLSQGDFSLLRFYDRRVRRILPAYAMMAAVTTLAALALLPPDMVTRFGSALSAASVFMANWHFLAATNYFAPGADEHLILHTWSLAVEEQFYLVWPLALVVLAHPRLKRVRPVVIFALMAVSLVMATRGAVLRPERAFYQSFARAWELLMGAVLALGLLPRLTSQRRAEGLAALGLALILGAAVFYDAATTIFPGAAALMPTGGAVLLIWAGEEGRVTRAGRLLSVPAWVGIGLISYSLYLWHWPIFAVAKLTFLPHPGPAGLAGLIAAAFGAGWLSWRYVEGPFRRYGPASPRAEWTSILVGLAVLGALWGAGKLIKAQEGFPGRIGPQGQAALAAVADRWPHTRACMVGPNEWKPLENCRFGDPDPDAPLVALFGDSFSNHHAPALDQVTRRAGFGLLQVAKAGCAAGAPGPVGPRPHTLEAGACRKFRAAALAKILGDARIKVVVMAGDWPAGAALGPAMAQVRMAVEELTAAGKAVILVAPTVNFLNGGGRCVMRRRFLGLSDGACSLPAAEAAVRSDPVETALARIAEGHERVRLIRLQPAFCDGERCAPLIDGRIVMTDRGHLNVDGSMHFTAAFAAALNGLTRPAPATKP